ncbi:MAG TPA: VCBS repeat-containing protein [Candidatus Binatia bacterium]|nr:VCBS repeat-containing protein [Candidatus Binatia bacterium]
MVRDVALLTLALLIAGAGTTVRPTRAASFTKTPTPTRTPRGTRVTPSPTPTSRRAATKTPRPTQTPVPTPTELGSLAINFRVAASFDGGQLPQAVAEGDLDNDGKVDLAVGAAGDGALRILRGKGTGAFSQTGTSLPVAADPVGIVLADFDEDGNLDLAVASRSSHRLSIFFGRGDLTFATPTVVNAGVQPAAVARWRNGVVVADSGGEAVVTFEIQPNRSVTQTSTIAVSHSPSALAVGDMNGDGADDVVIASAAGGTVSVLLDDGSGNLQSGGTLAVGRQPSAVAIGDVNADGRLDVVVANQGDDSVQVLVGTGRGGLSPRPALGVGPAPVAVAIASDLAAFDTVVTGDGNADLLVLCSGANRLDVLQGDARGGFSLIDEFAVGTAPVAMALGQFDNDANAAVDVAVANPNANTITVLRGNIPGAFFAAPMFSLPARPVGVAVGDFNGDTNLDCLASLDSGDAIALLRGNGRGSLRLTSQLSAGPSPGALASGDFDGDGQVDIAVANRGVNRLSILNGLATGFAAPKAIALSGEPDAIATTAPGMDDRAQVIVTEPSVQFVTTASIRPGGAAALMNVGVDGSAVNVVSADLNGDGLADFIATVADPSSVVAWIADSTGNPGVKTTTVLPDVPTAAAAADFDGDGVIDLAVLSNAAGRITLLSGRGNGSFRVAAQFDAPSDAIALVAGDLNFDGAVDLAVLSHANEAVTVFNGNGRGGFSSGASFAVGRAPVALALATLSADVLPDLIVADADGADVMVLRNTTRANLPTPTPTDTLGPGTPPPPTSTVRGQPPATSGSGGGGGGCEIARRDVFGGWWVLLSLIGSVAWRRSRLRRAGDCVDVSV